jgi:hypothetical protein
MQKKWEYKLAIYNDITYEQVSGLFTPEDVSKGFICSQDLFEKCKIGKNDAEEVYRCMIDKLEKKIKMFGIGSGNNEWEYGLDKMDESMRNFNNSTQNLYAVITSKKV